MSAPANISLADALNTTVGERGAPFDINAAVSDAGLTFDERREFANYAMGWFSFVDGEQCAKALKLWLSEHRREREAA